MTVSLLMKVTASNRLIKSSHFLRAQSTKGISRLKEIELINQSKQDVKNFRPLYDTYFPLILNYVYQKVADKELASDITSQVFLKVLTHIKKYKIQDVPFSAWLYKIAYNEAMLFFRKSKKMRSVVLDEELIEGISDELEEFPKEKIMRSMEGLIGRLKQAEFELIELRFYKGKPFREIGYILGCSENTAKVRSHRLIQKLKQELVKENRHEKI
jgi:RNA polymerase sigma-70 factor (ECF subfamily)